jgi:hypothetical protein
MCREQRSGANVRHECVRVRLSVYLAVNNTQKHAFRVNVLCERFHLENVFQATLQNPGNKQSTFGLVNQISWKEMKAIKELQKKSEGNDVL